MNLLNLINKPVNALWRPNSKRKVSEGWRLTAKQGQLIEFRQHRHHTSNTIEVFKLPPSCIYRAIDVVRARNRAFVIEMEVASYTPQFILANAFLVGLITTSEINEITNSYYNLYYSK